MNRGAWHLGYAAFGALLCASAFAQHSAMDHARMLEPLPSDGELVYMCPIHSDYTANAAGTCPRDGMPLVPSAAFDVRDYELEFRTEPSVPRAAEPLTLLFTIRHPETHEVVRDFVTVHDQRYHLFVVSQDLQHFEHLHPTQRDEGSWSIEIMLPRPGAYKVLSDFLPQGGAGQFVARPLITADYDGDLIAANALLPHDGETSKTVGSLTATLSFDPPTFLANLYGHLNFYVTDASTGEPVTDLQLYLGAFGHTLILSEDLVDYVHSHPLDLTTRSEESGPMLYMAPHGVDPASLRGGPQVTFDGLMPRPGRFRAFTQFRRHDELHTFTFTFDVVARDAAGPL